MNQTEQKLANKTKMLAYWQNEINSKGADKAAIQQAIDRLNKEILVISGGIAPQNPVIASEAKQTEINLTPDPSPILRGEKENVSLKPLSNLERGWGEVNPNESHKADIEIWQKLKERFDLILEPPSKETYLMDNCQTFNADFIPKFFQESDERIKVSNVKYERTAILKKADWILENW